MPRVAYSEEDRERIRTALITVGLELMAKQGMQHTTVEQVYKKVGISRTFFYSFFPTKEDLMLETLYWQQPRIIEYVQKLMSDPALKWRVAVKKFLHDCCYGGKKWNRCFNNGRTAADFLNACQRKAIRRFVKSSASFSGKF